MAKPARHTLTQVVELTGIGLHTGADVTMRLVPADPESGIAFRRTDLPDATPIRATVGAVTATDRHTVLGEGDNVVHTVEHVLAALAAHELDDVTIELDGPEPPIGDGSAREVFSAVAQAGVTAHDGEPRSVHLQAALTVREGDTHYVVAPASALRLTVTIEYQHPLISRQSGCFDITADAFDRELARARTFGFESERDSLLAAGLARGASRENTLILTETGLAAGELHWPDEFVRHKTVDLLGDLTLLGGRLAADITAFRPSHAGNVALVRAIGRFATLTTPTPYVAGIREIMGALPHRYPMLLVDRIIEVEEGKRIVGIKNVTINEPFFQGHFPDHPIMPGVLIVEAMAQTGGMMLMGAVENPEDKVVYFMSIDNVKFRRPVIPGDQIRFELEMLHFRGRNCRMRGVGYVEGRPAAEAEFMARIVDR